MTARGAAAALEPGSTFQWLVAHCRGVCAPGDVILHAPSFAFQAPGGGENQLVQSGRHLEELGIRVRLFSAWTDRLERRGCSICSGCRGKGSSCAGGQGSGDPGHCFADLLVRAASDCGARG